MAKRYNPATGMLEEETMAQGIEAGFKGRPKLPTDPKLSPEEEAAMNRKRLLDQDAMESQHLPSSFPPPPAPTAQAEEPRDPLLPPANPYGEPIQQEEDDVMGPDGVMRSGKANRQFTRTMKSLRK